MTAKILYVDLESTPNIAHVWSLWNQNVGLAQLKQASRIMGFAYRWNGGGKAKWVSEFDRERGEVTDEAHQAMLQKAWDLYDEADVVCTYNGESFDNKVFNTAWVTAGMTPPSPIVNLDLYKIVRRNFRPPSKKLAYIADILIGDTKVQTGGHSLWNRCIDPGVDPDVRRKAWAMMGRYCRQDVDLLEPLHERLEAWIPATVNLALIGGPTEEPGCPKCGGEDLQRRGFAYTATRAYQRFVCKGCGGWSRGKQMEWSAT